MQQRAERPLPHLLAQDRRHVVVGVAGVDDQRQASSRASAIWARKTRCGDVARRVIIMIVEPRLADADAFADARRSSRIARRRPPAPHAASMRMRADGEKHVVVALGDRDETRRLRRRGSRS